MNDGNFIQVLFDHATNSPDKTALKHRGQCRTFRELADEVRAMAVFLKAKGIRRGDRVLVFIPMSLSLYRVILALFYLGATAVFVDAWANRKRLTDAVQLAECRAFIGIPKAHLLRLLVPEIRKVPVKISIGRNWKPAWLDGIDPVYESVLPDDPALITFTTGSTGRPKAANRTFGFLWAQHLALADHLRLDPAETVLTTLPIFVLHGLAVGCTGIIPDLDPRRPERVEPRSAFNELQTERVDVAIGSPVFFAKLAEAAPGLPNHDVYPKRIFLGGAPVFPRDAGRLLNGFPRTAIEIVYGSTEAEPISFISAEHLSTAANSQPGLLVGRPVPGIELAILKMDVDPIGPLSEPVFRELTLPVGEVGEICVTGPHVLKAYYNSDEAWKATKIQAGEAVWHRTGDAGYRDAEGNLYLMGRVKQRFSHHQADFFVFPIEDRMLDIGGVRVGTVLKVNERVYAVLEFNGKPMPIEAVKSELAKRAIPFEQVKIFKKIPRDPRHNSKIDYERLKRMIDKD